MKPWFILSPCGTSILTNGATEAQRKSLSQYANAQTLAEIPEGDRNLLEKRIDEVKSKLAQATEKEAAQMSAELNGIIKLYKGQLQGAGDSHCLLCTDTWLGETTARLVASWLQQKMGVSQVAVHRQTDLRTADVMEFQSALSDLVRWAEETIPGYQAAGYHVVFNLTGGFKSVQGFLQTLAMFYADETIYIFETATDLLRIPRLPVRLNVLEEV
ncbi:MAG: putative CRISPR-associated protein, partial [Pseudanabaenaceae cyanobacterium]